jgi:hypothetical protein
MLIFFVFCLNIDGMNWEQVTAIFAGITIQYHKYYKNNENSKTVENLWNITYFVAILTCCGAATRGLLYLTRF